MNPTLDNITLRHQLEVVLVDRATIERLIGERTQEIQQAQTQIVTAQNGLLKLQGWLEYISVSQQRLTDQIKTAEDDSRAPAAATPQ